MPEYTGIGSTPLGFSRVGEPQTPSQGSPTEDTPTPQGGLEQPSGNSQSVATKSVTDVSYLKTWATRTRSDITPIKEELEQGNYETAKSLIGDVLVNFDELDKYLGGLQ